MAQPVVASVLLLLPELNMLVAGLLVVVLHRHRWNHLADLQRSRVIGRGGERETERTYVVKQEGWRQFM